MTCFFPSSYRCLVVFIYNACINSTIYLNVVCTIVCYLFSFCDGCFILPESNFKDVYSMVTPVTFCVIMSQWKNYDFRRASRQSIDKVYISHSDWIPLCLYRDDDLIYLGWFYEFNSPINVEK